MIDPKAIELMNRVLDGVATEPERADLDRMLTASTEARAHYEAISRLMRRLDAVSMIDPPSELHQRILAAVASVDRVSVVRPTSRAHRDHDKEHGFAAWLRHAFSPPGLRYGATFGLGLAAGAVILLVVLSGRPGHVTRGVDPSYVSGTISTPSTPTGLLPVAVPEVGVSGSVAVLDRGAVIQVRLKVDGEGTEWVFDVPNRDEPTQSVVLKVVKSGETVFEGAVQPVAP